MSDRYSDPEGNALDVGDVVEAMVDDDGSEIEVRAEVIARLKNGKLRLQIACSACGLKRRMTRRPCDVVLLERQA